MHAMRTVRELPAQIFKYLETGDWHPMTLPCFSMTDIEGKRDMAETEGACAVPGGDLQNHRPEILY